MGSIQHTLKYLTSKHYRNEVKRHQMEMQVKQEAADYFASLPPCRGNVLIASPSFGEGEYRCSVTIPAGELLAWTKTQAETTIVPWPDEVSRPAFQHWLSKAEPGDTGASPLPEGYFESIQSEIADWATNGIAQVWCHACNEAIADITFTELDRNNSGNSFYWWTSVWHCPAGHELYRAKKEMRILRTSHRIKID